MRSDLHVHSTASDGTLTPRALLALARHNDVEVLALADHDSVAGLDEARGAALDFDVNLVPAVELSATDDGRDVHVLAYHIDSENPEVGELLSTAREARIRRAQTMVAALREGGLDIDLEDVYAISGAATLGRSHVARALVARGHATSVTDAFSRLIGHDRPFYVPKPSRPSHEVITTVRRLGAVPVLAHPGITKVDDLIPSMVASGLLGIEAYHADHDASTRARYARLAAQLGLIATGGTDYHGPDSPNPDLGSVDVPADQVRRLLRLGVRS